MDVWQLTPWDEVDMVLRLVMAGLMGGIVGYERERAEKPACLCLWIRRTE